MNVKIGICSDDNRTVYKSVVWCADIECNLKFNTSIENPVLQVVGRPLEDFSNINYVYISKMHRYYYINNIELRSGGLLELTCHVDVLNSFKDEIVGLSPVVERNEFVYNPYIVDSELLVRADRIFSSEIVGFINQSEGANIVLTVCNGGNENE